MKEAKKMSSDGPEFFAKARDIVRPHINRALEPELCGHRRGGDTVLTGPGFGDDPGLAHTACQQALPHHVVRLVRTRVVQILALDEETGASELFRQIVETGDRRRATRVGRHQLDVFVPERRIIPRLEIRRFKFVEGGHQDFGDEGTTELAVVAAVSH